MDTDEAAETKRFKATTTRDRFSFYRRVAFRLILIKESVVSVTAAPGFHGFICLEWIRLLGLGPRLFL